MTVRRAAKTAAVAAAFCLGALGSAQPAAADTGPETADETLAPSADLGARLAEWVIRSGDNHDLPFVIVDKTAATVRVFTAAGQLVGAAPALLGLSAGDDSAPGIGERELSAIGPEDRTTPAGRFVALFGPSKGQGRVLWVEFATALSLHPVVTSNPKERRLQRLKSPSPEDNRITFGCINVSAQFYQDVVRKTLEDRRGVVYILPEVKPLEEVFPSFALAMREQDEDRGTKLGQPELRPTHELASGRARTGVR